jgi:hypothetical protein
MLKAEEARVYVGKIIPVAYGAPRGVAKSYLPSREKGIDYVNYTDYTGHLKNKQSVETTRVLEVYIECILAYSFSLYFLQALKPECRLA